MNAELELYTKPKQTSNDDERAEVIAGLATHGDVRDTGLCLQKESKEVVRS